MAKFNRASEAAKVRDEISVVGGLVKKTKPKGVTFEGADAYKRDVRSELFLLAAGRFFGEDTFYESAHDGADRFRKLARKAVLKDREWYFKFVEWLRAEGNMRTAPLVLVAEAFVAQAESGEALNLRGLVPLAVKRADEPGELIAYWRGRYGRKLPASMQRGLADALQSVYTEYAAIKYDSPARGFRMGDVLEIVHPTPKAEWQSQLFRYLLDRKAGRDAPVIGDALSKIMTNRNLMKLPVDLRRGVLLSDAKGLQDAGVTWEQVAGWLQGPMDGPAWEAVIPSMGYMATLRNLRNFEQAGVSNEVLQKVAERLMSLDEVKKSKQFPFRFLSAYKNITSDRFKWPLDLALNYSAQNVPDLGGRTLVLVDTSASMQSGLSGKSQMSYVEVAALFGVTLAVRSPGSQLFGFATGQFEHKIPKGASVLSTVEKFCQRIGEVGHGTAVAAAIRNTFDGHDRVIVISDEQTRMERGSYGWLDSGTVTDALPKSTPLYAFNLGGYAPAMADYGQPNRVQLGGLTDSTFRLIAALEAGNTGSWPWEV